MVISCYILRRLISLHQFDDSVGCDMHGATNKCGCREKHIRISLQRGFNPGTSRAELAWASSRLSQIGAQKAQILLRGSFSAPKVLHLLRCSPSVSHSALPEFDKLLRLAVERITNSSLTDSQWLQLPIKDGGLGVRQACYH